MNKVILMGRLTRDPNITTAQTAEGAMTIARYTLAVDRMGRKAEGDNNADFISCVAFGKSGDFAEKYLRQGMKIAVAGRIQTGSYTNKDGNKVYTTDIIVENHEFCESKASQNGAQTSAPKTKSNEDFMAVGESMDDGLPFA